MDTDGTVSEVKVAHTGDPEVGCKCYALLTKNFRPFQFWTKIHVSTKIKLFDSFKHHKYLQYTIKFFLSRSKALGFIYGENSTHYS